MVVCGLLAVAPGHAMAKRRAAQTIVLQPRFHRAGIAGAVETDGRYTLVAAPATASGPFGVLIDEQTGRRTIIPYASFPSLPGDCSNGGLGNFSFGGPWLLVSACATPLAPTVVDLYSLASATSTLLQLDVPFCSDYGAECSFGPIGADWLEIDEACYHCTTQYQFANLNTGELRGLPATNSRTILDLSSPTLTRKLCSNVTVPSRGTVTFYGKLAVVAFVHATLTGYVERCGARRRVPLAPGPILGNSRELLWDDTDQLDGMTLPGMKQFVVALPKAFPAGMTGFVLSSRTLYATLNSGVFWATAAPQPPKSK